MDERNGYIVLDTDVDEAAVVLDVFYWISIPTPVTIDGQPVVVTPAASFRWPRRRSSACRSEAPSWTGDKRCLSSEP
jgi:hypothetical protein